MAGLPGVDGIGFVFTAGRPVLRRRPRRLHHRRRLHPDAADIVRRLDSYTERSVSGTGVHVIGRADLNGFTRNRTSKTPWGGEFEVYDRGRFFVVTGDQLHGSPDRAGRLPGALEPLLAELFPPRRANGRAETAAEHAHGRRGARARLRCSERHATQALYRGDTGGYGSRSEADLALCSMLAFWTGRTPTSSTGCSAARG